MSCHAGIACYRVNSDSTLLSYSYILYPYIVYFLHNSYTNLNVCYVNCKILYMVSTNFVVACPIFSIPIPYTVIYIQHWCLSTD